MMKTKSKFNQTEIGLIPEDWTIKRLEEVCQMQKGSIISGPFGSNIGSRFFVKTGIPVIRGNNLSTDFRKLIDNGFVFITPEKARELNTWADEDDLIFTAAGTLGQVGIVPKNRRFERYIISNKQLRARLDKNSVNPLFAFYWFQSKQMIEHVSMRSTGSTIPLINLSVLRSLPLPYPDLEEQTSIANILSKFDSKIELNQQMNKTLEEMGRSIFKHCFIDFEFPNEEGKPYKSSGGKMVDSELGKIPKGWGVKSLDSVTETIFSGGTPDTSNSEYWDGEHPWLSSGETRDHFIVRTDKTITEKGIENSGTRMVKDGDIVIASAGQGSTRGQTSFCLIDTYINQSIVALRPKANMMTGSYLFFNLSMRYSELRTISDSHSIRGSLTTKLLKGLEIVVPPLHILSFFDSWFIPTTKRIHSNMLENHLLAQIRDLLLPRLMSGKIRVPIEAR